MESVCHYRWITSTNMNMRTFFIAVVICLFSSCTNKDDLSTRISTVTKVLMLKVDYLTNTFEGGKETIYATASSTFTTSVQYKEPSDFLLAWLKLSHSLLNQFVYVLQDITGLFHSLFLFSSPDDRNQPVFWTNKARWQHDHSSRVEKFQGNSNRQIL
jgi:hypothetical protein